MTHDRVMTAANVLLKTHREDIRNISWCHGVEDAPDEPRKRPASTLFGLVGCKEYQKHHCLQQNQGDHGNLLAAVLVGQKTDSQRARDSANGCSNHESSLSFGLDCVRAVWQPDAESRSDGRNSIEGRNQKPVITVHNNRKTHD
jgi:hypothetical protein